ncbi:MAG: segregation/condensation protein A [Caldilineaceae bacterium]|nr:segregation/condensation protein A [Caldilineaceae bacterium]MDE0337546.1 segregation/condensation protein A [Caldilineaceae bacterium]
METALNPLGAGYPVSLPIFDGPIGLLLHLIEREELDITEVSLVAITDQYLREIEAMQEIEPEALADFLVVAARLLYIKSRGLLPQPEGEEEEEESNSEALIQQLLDYRRFRAAAGELRLRASIGLRTSARLTPPQMDRRLDLSALTIEKLADAAQKALSNFPSDPALPSVRAYPITVAEKIESIRERIRGRAGENGNSGGSLTFSGLLSQSRSRQEIIVTFLAVLELIKQKEIAAAQEKTFGEILLRSVQ